MKEPPPLDRMAALLFSFFVDSFLSYFCEPIIRIICNMSLQNVYLSILSSARTVFTIQQLMMLTSNFDKNSLCKSLKYYKDKGMIKSPRKGIYTKINYNPLELACSINEPSYLSLQYVLSRAGVVFQYSERITCVSAVSRTLVVDGNTFEFRRINPVLWSDYRGIEERGGYLVASPERALVDMLYLYPGITFFDNIGILDKKEVKSLSRAYNNYRLEQTIQKIYG